MKLKWSIQHTESDRSWNKMNYVYKKGSSRPTKSANQRNLVVKRLYWTEFLRMIHQGKILINIDESSFDRSVKEAYSWLPKGESHPILNNRFKGRAWLILATWSDCRWFGIILQKTVNSNIFWIFLKLLELLVTNENLGRSGMPMAIMDNAPTHRSGLTKLWVEKLQFEVRFLAPYWPELAPVEQAFGALKTKLRALESTRKVDFGTKSGAELILSLVGEIKESTWMNAWIKAIKEAKKSVVDKDNDRILRQENMHKKKEMNLSLGYI